MANVTFININDLIIAYGLGLWCFELFVLSKCLSPNVILLS